MFSTVKPLTKYIYIKSIRIYDFVFTLHSHCTVVLLLISSALLSAKQYFGDPIECQGVTKDNSMVNTFCWTMGTYLFRSTDLNGVQSNWNRLQSENLDDRVYYRYYQWVVLILLLEALMYYFPAFLWKIWEGQRLSQLCSDCNDALLSSDTMSTKLELLTKYFTTDYKVAHAHYMLKYVFCEVLNFVLGLLNIKLLDLFLNGFWSDYLKALMAIAMDDWNSWDTYTSVVFPKLTKCEFYRYGSSGSAEHRDLLCILPLNVLNEKIFAFFYVWYLFIAILAGLNLIYRVCTILIKEFRLQVLRSKCRSISLRELRLVMDDFNLSDWFILLKVSSNINPVLFKELLSEIYNQKSLSKQYGSPI